MLTRIFKLGFSLTIVVLFLSTLAGAEMLFPPIKIPFAKDVTLEKYAQGQLLNLFKYRGKWEMKNIKKKLTLVGTSDEAPIYLISEDKLSKQPKAFKFDFIIHDSSGEFGFIYGKLGIIIRNGKVYPASYDAKANALNLSSRNGETIYLSTGEKFNTLSIDTGYDQTGGASQICVIYINGIGITFKNPDVDSEFGVYVGPNNSIMVNNFRWGIGTK
jgi:hypothetical protein